MRTLFFFLWLGLGVIYFLIWNNQREICCNQGSFLESKKLSSIPAIPNENQANQPNVIAAAKEAEAGCLLFEWGKSDLIKTDCFLAWQDSILRSVGEGQTLEITGNYFESENQIMSSGDIGLIRAIKLKNNWVSLLQEDRIRVKSKIMDFREGVQNKFFPAIELKNIVFNDQIKETGDKTIFYFKYASNEDLTDSIILKYIKNLADKLKTNEDLIRLVGHTDDDASEAHNMKLGLKRAQMIKDVFTEYGIKSNRIKTASKGESEPIVANDVEENRRLNRRVEMFIESKLQ